MKKTIKKNIDDKLPIYKLTSKNKVLEYYDDWTKNSQFNQDMIDWNYTAPSNTVHLVDQYMLNKNLKILDAGCGSGLAGIELKNKGYTNIHGVDFSQSMLDLVPQGIYKKIEKIDITKDVPVSTVDTTGLPKPAVVVVDANRVAPAELFIAAAVPPPAIIAKDQVIIGLKSATVDTITAVPATVANGIAIVSNKLSK